MKKLFVIMMLGVFVLLTSCQLDNLNSDSNYKDEVDVTISANLPNNLKSRSTETHNVSRYILEVYIAGTDELYKRTSQDSPSFTTRLLVNMSYDFVFWADSQSDENEPYFITNNELGLKDIRMVYPYEGNNQNRDAFFNNELKNITISSVIAKSVILKRPFAQLNIATGLKDVPTAYYPKYSKLTFKADIFTKFNAMDGAASEALETELAWSNSADIANAANIQTAFTNVATDYILVNSVGQNAALNVEFFTDAAMTSKVTERAFENIPLKRNYRTNVVGELLTYNSEIDVTIDEIFDGPNNDIVITDPLSISEIIKQEADKLAASGEKGEIVINMTTPILDGSINELVNVADFISTDNVTKITINLLGGITAENFTITDLNPTTLASNYTGIIELNVKGECKNLTVNIPNASFIVGEGTYKIVNATTKPETFTIEEGVLVEDITVNAGSIMVKGVVNTLRKGSSLGITVDGKGVINKAIITNNDGINLSFFGDITKVKDIELNSTGKIVVNNTPYTGLVKVLTKPEHLLVKSGFVSYDGSKYSTNFINDYGNKWYGFGLDLGVDLSLIGIPRYLGLHYLGAKAQFDFGGNGFTAKKLTEIKYTANNASASLAFDLSSITNAQDIQNKVNSMISSAMGKLPTETQLRSTLEKYLSRIPADKKAEITKIFNEAIDLVYHNFGLGITIPNPTVKGVTVPTYFKSDDNISSAKIEQINNGLKFILSIVNGIVDAEEALESVKVEIARLEAEAARLTQLIADYDAQIALIDGPALTIQKSISSILLSHNILVGRGNATKRAEAVAQLDSYSYSYSQGITRSELLNYSVLAIGKLNKAVAAQAAIVYDMEQNGSPATAELKGLRSNANKSLIETNMNLLIKKGDEALKQLVVETVNKELEALGLGIDLEILTKILEPMISVLDLSIQVIRPVEDFVDRVNPWVYTGTIKSNEVIREFKINVKLGDIVEVEKTC